MVASIWFPDINNAVSITQGRVMQIAERTHTPPPTHMYIHTHFNKKYSRSDCIATCVNYYTDIHMQSSVCVCAHMCVLVTTDINKLCNGARRAILSAKLPHRRESPDNFLSFVMRIAL